MKKSRGEIISNAIINGLLFPVSIVMMIILIINSNNALNIIFDILISVGIMTTSIFLVLYYSLRIDVFKKLSYIFCIVSITIYLNNLCLNDLNTFNWILFGFSICLCIINVIFSSINIKWFKYICFVCNMLLLISFITFGVISNLNNIVYITLIINLSLVLLFYYLYNYNVFIHYLLSIFILILNMVMYVDLLI